MCSEEKLSIGDITGIIDTHPNLDGHKVLFEIIKTHLDQMEGVCDKKKINHERNNI